MTKSKDLLLIGLLVLLILLIGYYFTSKKSGFEKIKPDSVVVVYANWCGHCKKAKPEFEKAAKAAPGKVVLLDGTTPEGQKYMKEHNVKGFPSIVQGNKTLDIPRTSDAILKAAGK